MESAAEGLAVVVLSLVQGAHGIRLAGWVAPGGDSGPDSVGPPGASARPWLSWLTRARRNAR